MLAKELSKGWYPERWGDPSSRIEMYTDSLELIDRYRPPNPHLIDGRGPQSEAAYGLRLTSFGVPNCKGVFSHPTGLVEKQGVECYVIYAPAHDMHELKAEGFVTDPRDLEPEPVKRRRKPKVTDAITDAA